MPAAPPPYPSSDAVAQAADTPALVDPAVVWDLLMDIVSIPSVTGDTTDCVAKLIAWADQQGLPHGTLATGAPWISTASDPFKLAPGREHVLMFGHIDTVRGDIPVHVELDPENDDQVLHGRGTVDAKGCIASYAGLVRGMRARQEDEPGETPVYTLIAAVDEEGDSATAYLVRDLMQSNPPSSLLIGEPSGSGTVCLGYKGRVTLTLRAETAAAHGGSPVPTATDHLVRVIDRLLDRYGTVPSAARGTPDSWFPVTTTKVLGIESRHDGLNDLATARLDVRLPPDVTPERLDAEVDELLDGFRHAEGLEEHGKVLLESELNDRIPAMLVDRKDPLVRRLRSAIRRASGESARLVRKTGTSDLNILLPAWQDTHAAVYGPGDSSLDHGPEERIARSEVAAACRVLSAAFE